jgi:hypothetical protein
LHLGCEHRGQLSASNIQTPISLGANSHAIVLCILFTHR